MNGGWLVIVSIWLLSILGGCSAWLVPLGFVGIVILAYLLKSGTSHYIANALLSLRGKPANKTLRKKLKRHNKAMYTWALFVSVGVFMLGNSVGYGVHFLAIFIFSFLIYKFYRAVTLIRSN